MPYSKHTNMELLMESYNCICDLLHEIAILNDGKQPSPKVQTLRYELYQRTKGVTFDTGRTHGD